MVTPKLPPITVYPARLPADKLGMLAARIIDRRRAMGLTQRGLAKKADISLPVLGGFEAGTRSSLWGLDQIAQALEVGTYWLINGGQRPTAAILAGPAGHVLRESPKGKGPSEEGPVEV
jgi:transcriptional regulator with XRE-family HTH domain